ncbi:MAG: type II toxin-antitoxin system VapC family toxin [Thaumarchaeota archaeon]|nr:type II toxin-antitoxin system VapC family toxin [Nitrososphaerota archaeon]
MLVDSNIFLEVELAQERGQVSRKFLSMLSKGEEKAFTTEFHLDNVTIVMENYGRGWRDIAVFLTSIIQYEGLKIYPLSILDKIGAASVMREEGLDFDDALLAYAAKKENSKTIVSYDQDFDRVSWLTRREPEDF